MKLKSTKAIITAIGGFLTFAASNFIDDILPVGNLGNIIAGFIGLASTIYTTWRVPNRPKDLIGKVV